MSFPVRRFAVIGHPVAHSRSPFIHSRFAEAEGITLDYGRIDATADEFEPVVRAFFADGGQGLNVTVPHKEAAATLVDERSERAEAAGAVNTIIPLPDGTLRGDNTDGVGLVTDLERNLGYSLLGKRILLIGAGGAARGVIGPLLACMPLAVCVVNRTASRAIELAQRFTSQGRIFGGAIDLLATQAPFDLIINATSAGIEGEAVALPTACTAPGTLAYDMMYAAGGTPFTRQMAALGVRESAMGYGMLVEQAAEAFYLWHGVRPKTRVVLDLLRS